MGGHSSRTNGNRTNNERTRTDCSGAEAPSSLADSGSNAQSRVCPSAAKRRLVEPPTTWFEARCSIQLSYGRVGGHCSRTNRRGVSPWRGTTLSAGCAPMAKKFYVVWRGIKTGMFHDWPTTLALVDGFSGAQYKSFPTLAEAEAAFRSGAPARSSAPAGGKPRVVRTDHADAVAASTRSSSAMAPAIRTRKSRLRAWRSTRVANSRAFGTARTTPPEPTTPRNSMRCFRH